MGPEVMEFLGDAPRAVFHLAVALGVAFLGIALLVRLTAHDEAALMLQGNVAAATSLAGIFVGVSVPVAVAMAASATSIQVVVWGVLAVVIQALGYLGFKAMFPGTTQAIERGDMARAVALAGFQVALAVLNAAATT